MKPIRVIFIPGNGGADIKGGWFPFVKHGLGELGLAVIDRSFPDPGLARAKYWLPFIESLGADDQTILVGHSSGSEAALRFAETHVLLGSVLVSACQTDLGLESERVSGYYDRPWQWDKIKRHQQWIIQFHSLDDPFVPVAEAREVHRRLESEYYEFTDQGHFGGNWDKTEFPELIEVIKDKLKAEVG